MTTTLDTNVLVYASDTGAPEHERAQALLEHLAAGPDLSGGHRVISADAGVTPAARRSSSSASAASRSWRHQLHHVHREWTLEVTARQPHALLTWAAVASEPR